MSEKWYKKVGIEKIFKDRTEKIFEGRKIMKKCNYDKYDKRG